MLNGSSKVLQHHSSPSFSLSLGKGNVILYLITILFPCLHNGRKTRQGQSENQLSFCAPSSVVAWLMSGIKTALKHRNGGKEALWAAVLLLREQKEINTKKPLTVPQMLEWRVIYAGGFESLNLPKCRVSHTHFFKLKAFQCSKGMAVFLSLSQQGAVGGGASLQELRIFAQFTLKSLCTKFLSK